MADTHTRRITRTAAYAAVGLLALATAGGLVGCADAVTFSRTETAKGRIYLEEGDAESAAVIFANQVRRNPKDHRAHYYLGVARQDSGRFQEAIRSFKTGLEVMPLTVHGADDAEFRFLLTDALSSVLAEHDPDGSQLAQIEKTSKGDKHAKLLIAMTHAKAGRPDNAINAFQEAANLDRHDPQIFKQYGLYLASLRQEESAVKVLTRAYALNTQDQQVASALQELGVVPGPSLMSKVELAKPAVPLGPLPQINIAEKPEETGKQPGGETAPEAAQDGQASAQESEQPRQNAALN